MSTPLWPAAGDGRLEAPGKVIYPKGTITDLSAMNMVYAGSGAYGTLAGDGATDDYATLHAALQAAGPGSVLVIPQPAVSYYLSQGINWYAQGCVIIGPGTKGKGGAAAFSGPGAVGGATPASWLLRAEAPGESIQQSNPEPVMVMVSTPVPANHVPGGALASDDFIGLYVKSNSVNRAGVGISALADGDALYISLSANDADPTNLAAGWGLDIQTNKSAGGHWPKSNYMAIFQNPNAGTFGAASVGPPSCSPIGIFDATSAVAGTDNPSIDVHSNKLAGAALSVNHINSAANSYNALFMNLGQAGSGAWNGTFMQLQNAGALKFQIDNSGQVMAANGYRLGSTPGNGAPTIATVSGAPAFAAPGGSIAIRNDAGAAAGARVYVNQAAGGASGSVWAAIAGV